MGTNYYFIKNKKREMEEDNLIHIGKNSYGWAFSFEAYFGDDEVPVIESCKGWIDFLSKNKKSIVNEYQEFVSFKEFVELLKSKAPGEKTKDGEPLLQHHEEMIKRKIDQSYLNDLYTDEDGYSFSKNYFS